MPHPRQALAESAVGSGEGWLTEMSTDELKGLFALDPDTTGDALGEDRTPGTTA